MLDFILSHPLNCLVAIGQHSQLPRAEPQGASLGSMLLEAEGEEVTDPGWAAQQTVLGLGALGI